MTPSVPRLSAAAALPTDVAEAALVGRVWRPEFAGPSIVAVDAGGVRDVTATFATMRDLLEAPDPAAAARGAPGERVCDADALFRNSDEARRDDAHPWLLAPFDLAAVKAAGVTFAASMLERVIDERARGDVEAAGLIRMEIVALVGDDLSRLKPGSDAALRLKEILIAQGAWSQYLEVGIGRDAEIFTKAQPMSVRRPRHGDAGLHPSLDVEQSRSRRSFWSSRRPEGSSARRSATTSTCATSRGAPRCCSARPRTTTPPARSGR